jgi:cell division protein YceG involved in septum cleavage
MKEKDYRVSSRTARALQRNPVSKNQKTKQTNKQTNKKNDKVEGHFQPGTYEEKRTEWTVNLFAV